MDKIVVSGGNPLKGSVEISGAKNAVLPIMAASILAPGKFILENVPDLRDTHTMANLLRIIGAHVEFKNGTMEIDSSNCNYPEAPYELVRTMRASFYVLGPLTAKFKRAKVSLPGGCAWGPRPVDLHIKGLKKLGAEIELDKGYLIANCAKLKGTKINLDVSSVGATGNILMAAVLAEGITVIENAAKEPEIAALANFLKNMGAEIRGIGTDRLEIEGVKELHPVEFKIIPDRIEAGTFLIAAVISGGSIILNRVEPGNLTSLLEKLKECGSGVREDKFSISIDSGGEIKPVDVVTAIYPGFPTDMQAQWMALMSIADGTSLITDNIYIDRFTHVPELNRLGADIKVDGNVAIVKGVRKLKGAHVMSTDIRASASLILAGLVADGRTDIHRVYHIDRGYEKIVKKLKSLGADIWREEENSLY
ncbi:MAG: UDP-N-acetylglucosamine 1-carboxyvinyltransferase [Fidelibacterota bacterium]